MANITLAESLDIFQSGHDEFTSTHNPQHIGPNPSVAYGGCMTGYAVMSAFKTVTKPNFHVYSMLGAFHGPTFTDRPVICRVTRTRDTRSFVTRRVVVFQKQNGGAERPCADMFVDFHVLEGEMMKFSAAPSRNYGDGPDDRSATATGREIAGRLIETGQAPQDVADKYEELYALQERYFEKRSCLDGVSAQTLYSVCKHIKTTQDDLPITDRCAAEWIRSREPLETEAENTAAFVHLLDIDLGPLPLTVDHKNFDDVGPCSTLDIALRIMLPGIQMHKWHLIERKTIAAGVGRSYSEGRVWDEDGNLVAVTNQSCILRPPRKAKI